MNQSLIKYILDFDKIKEIKREGKPNIFADKFKKNFYFKKI